MLAIIMCFYKNLHIIPHLITFYDNLNIEYDFFIVCNNAQNFETIDLTKYEKNVHFVQGDNTLYEFTGIQKCIDSINKNKYSCYILGTDALFNHPIYYLDFITKDMILYAFNNQVCMGNLDCFNETYECNHFQFSYWLRTSFIIINNLVLKNINYKFITFQNSDVVKISSKLDNFLNNWLNNERYAYISKNIKLKCIFNEYAFTNKIKDKCKIYDFYIAHHFHFYKYSLTKHNENMLITTHLYENSLNVKNLKLLEPEEQIHFKNRVINM